MANLAGLERQIAALCQERDVLAARLKSIVETLEQVCGLIGGTAPTTKAAKRARRHGAYRPDSPTCQQILADLPATGWQLRAKHGAKYTLALCALEGAGLVSREPAVRVAGRAGPTGFLYTRVRAHAAVASGEDATAMVEA